jgi:tetratricopeptide (TPR) repeat protein
MDRETIWGVRFAVAAGVLSLAATCLPAQSSRDEIAPPEPAIASLQLSEEAASQLQRAMNEHDYITAERLLLAQIDDDSHSARAARLLAYAGGVYFRDQDYMNAAIAWKKSEAITPLDPTLKFCLAMAFIRISHPDWARSVLESLAAQHESEASYPYWLGRLSYDGHEYEKAIQYFKRAIQVDPRMARAYDNLGLCYYYENQNELAIANYQKAIELDRDSPHPSPWPYQNLAVTQQFLNRSADAEKNLREALRLDPTLAKAHFQLGTVLEDRGRPEDALTELGEAARLDGGYAEPHMAIARILHKLGREADAKKEVEAYRHLHAQTSR